MPAQGLLLGCCPEGKGPLFCSRQPQAGVDAQQGEAALIRPLEGLVTANHQRAVAPGQSGVGQQPEQAKSQYRQSQQRLDQGQEQRGAGECDQRNHQTAQNLRLPLTGLQQQLDQAGSQVVLQLHHGGQGKSEPLLQGGHRQLHGAMA